MKFALYKDPLTEVGIFNFSDLFTEGVELSSDWSVEVYRTGHKNVQGDTLQLFRRGDVAKKFARVTKLATDAQKEVEAMGEEEREAKGIGGPLERMNEILTEIADWTPEEQEALSTIMGGNVIGLVRDVIDLPVEVNEEGKIGIERAGEMDWIEAKGRMSEDGKVCFLRLSDYPPDIFDYTLRQLLKTHEGLGAKIRQVAEEKEAEFRSYQKQAKNASAPSSTTSRGGQAKKSDLSTAPVSGSISN